MRSLIDTFFKENKIEYYSVLSYSDVRETRKEIMARESFTPRSVIVYLLPYYVGAGENLSSYATSLDYHIILKRTAEGLIGAIKEKRGEVGARGYGDHSPIDERHAALVSGLGILGDSGLLINEKYGTYVFIGDVITDIPPEQLGAVLPMEAGHCVGCGRCRAACPTGILRGEGDDCLSAITQRKGELTPCEIEMMRKFNTIWGCDICQTACPYNDCVAVTPLNFFREERIAYLDSEVLGGMSKEEFLRRAFAWRGRKTVERNLGYFGI